MARLKWFQVGLCSLALAVALGAFGAHGLESWVRSERLDTWQVGVRYHAWISLALMVMAVWPGVIARGALWCLAIGIGVFAGSLYLLVVLDVPMLGAITPIGGVLMMIGLGWAAISASGPT